MSRKVISTDRAPRPGGAYSQAIRVGGQVFTAGQVGIEPTSGQLAQGLEGQIIQAIANLEQVLRTAGATMADITKTTCFLADIDRFADFDAAYSRLMPDPKPARSTVGVRLAGDLQFEIEAVAVVHVGDGTT